MSVVATLTGMHAYVYVCTIRSYWSCSIFIPFSHSPTSEWIDFCEYLFFGMSDSNYIAFEDNIIGAVTQMAFGSP